MAGESHEEPCSLMQSVGLPIFHHCWQNRAILPAVSCESSALWEQGNMAGGNPSQPGEQGLTLTPTRVTAGKAPQEFKSSLSGPYCCSQSRKHSSKLGPSSACSATLELVRRMAQNCEETCNQDINSNPSSW